MKKLLAVLAFVSLIAAPHFADAQLQPGCYSGVIGNGAANGNVVSSITTSSTTTLTVSAGCTPVITIGPTVDEADIKSIGNPPGTGDALPIDNAYISNLVATMYGFASTSVLSGYALDGLTVPSGVALTPTPIPTSTPGAAVLGIENGTGTYVTNIGSSFVIGPTTAVGTAGNSQNLYFVANTSSSSSAVAPYINASTAGALNFHLQSPQQILTNNAPLSLGSGFLIAGGEHNNTSCGTMTGATSTTAPTGALSSGTSSSYVALGNQGPNCVGTFDSTGHAYYSFSNSNLTNPCIQATPYTTSGTPPSIGFNVNLVSTTWDVIFTSSAAAVSTFTFHIAGCPN